jgi:hypothetical protein
MPVRIPVVLSQAPAAVPYARQLEEDLIAGLMLERGVDVSVVPDLTQLHEGTTGLLCLRGIKGDLIVLTWLEPEPARRILHQRGVFGQDWLVRIDCNLGQPTATADSSRRRPDRRLHILQLDAKLSSEWYLREVRRLRDIVGPEASNLDRLPVIHSPAPDVVGPSGRSDAGRVTGHQVVRGVPQSVGEPSVCPAAGTDELDQLLNQLDALDL